MSLAIRSMFLSAVRVSSLPSNEAGFDPYGELTGGYLRRGCKKEIARKGISELVPACDPQNYVEESRMPVNTFVAR